jgi:Gas vesicle protein G
VNCPDRFPFESRSPARSRFKEQYDGPNGQRTARQLPLGEENRVRRDQEYRLYLPEGQWAQGLLSDLLLPVTGPVWGLRFIAAQVKEQVDAKWDPAWRAQQVQAGLIRLNMRRDLGQISADEYAAQEAALLAQLSALRAELKANTEDIGSWWQKDVRTP